jgi:hypothetical protein
MRLSLLVISICLFALGCNSDPRCRRETALLRSEILDLEDKYYLLKSKYEATTGYNASDQMYGEPYYSDGQIIDGQIIDGQIIGSTIRNESPTQEQYANGQVVDGGIFYDGVIYDELSYQRGIESGDIVFQSSGGTANDYNSNPIDLSPNTDSYSNAASVQADGYGQLNLESGAGESDMVDQNLDNYPSLEGPESSLTSSGQDLSVGYETSDTQSPITEIQINRQVTRGRDVDGMPGHEGIDLLVQAKTADGQIKLQTGELVVKVIDPQLPKSDELIGLWSFTESDVPLFFANDEIGSHGVLLHLPWEEATPTNSRLIVNVRFTMPDGRVLNTSSDIRIEPPSSNYSPDDPVVAGWTKRDERWIIDNDAVQGDWRENQSPRSQRTRNMESNSVVSSVNQNPGGSQIHFEPSRPKVRATPAKAVIEQPRWRPVR